MTRSQYWLLNVASLAVAVLIACEMMSVHQLENVSLLVQRAQVPIAEAQRQAPQLQALVRRTALGATRDPALKDLLMKHGVSLTTSPAAPPRADAGDSLSSDSIRTGSGMASPTTTSR